MSENKPVPYNEPPEHADDSQPGVPPVELPTEAEEVMRLQRSEDSRRSELAGGAAPVLQQGREPSRRPVTATEVQAASRKAPDLPGPDLSDIRPGPASTMSFIGGSLCLRDGTRLRQYLIKDPNRTVAFDNHQCAISTPDVAERMLRDKVNFQQPHGFFVEEECLPPEIRAVWMGLHLENKRAVAIALTRGASVEASLGLVNAELQELQSRKDDKGPAKTGEESCEFCGVQVHGTDTRAQLAAHQKALHPIELRAATR